MWTRRVSDSSTGRWGNACSGAWRIGQEGSAFRTHGDVIEEINGEREDLRVVKLNVDDNQQTAAAYGIMAIPTMLVFRNGQEAARIQGAMPKKRIEAQLDPVLA